MPSGVLFPPSEQINLFTGTYTLLSLPYTVISSLLLFTYISYSEKSPAIPSVSSIICP